VGFRSLIGHDALRQLYDYWLSRRSGRPVPLRRDIDPIAMTAPLLPHLIIAERAGGDLRYRLVGTRIVEAHGLDYTGWTLSRLATGEALALARQLYRPVMDKGVPVYSEGPFTWPGGEFRWTRRLHLPMSRDGDGIDMALVGQVFDPRPATHGAALIRAATFAEVDADAAAGDRA
jgi:hypothetical protein